jgi:hypothetical protein
MIATFRVVVACVVVLVACMALRIPEPIAVWVVTGGDGGVSDSLLIGLVFLVALTIGLAMPLVFLTSLDAPGGLLPHGDDGGVGLFSARRSSSARSAS